jgi:type IX secretion system PorP/SprF family membrane protein
MMKKIFRTAALLLSAISCQDKVLAQSDPHFTQYYVYPSWLNPALTGAFDGAYRVSGIYRTQWGNISSPYSTFGLTADFTTNKNMNFGVSVLNQTAGDGGYRYTTAYANLAYTGVRFGPMEYQRVTLGLQAGLIQRSFDPTKLTFGDQWNAATGYNPDNQTADVLSSKSVSSFDAGAGILYFNANPGLKANLYAGFSASHLTKPKDEFSKGAEETLPMRYTAHAGVRIKLSSTVTLTPNALYLKQGTAYEAMLGAYAQFKAGPYTDFLAGANYRFDDAASPFVGFTHKRFIMGVSYDINTSDLGKVAKGSNSFEISLSITGKRSVKTPEVEFICPRL